MLEKFAARVAKTPNNKIIQDEAALRNWFNTTPTPRKE